MPLSSLSQLPAELRIRIAEEVIGLRAIPSNNIKTSMGYDEYVQACNAWRNLRYVDSFFLDITTDLFKRWALFRANTDDIHRGWPRHFPLPPLGNLTRFFDSPLRYKLASPEHNAVGALEAARRLDQQLPELVQNMAMTGKDFSFLQIALKLTFAMTQAGSHQPANFFPLLGSVRSLRPEMVRQTVTQFNRLQPVNQVINSRNYFGIYLLSWPCESLRYLTIVVKESQAIGWGLVKAHNTRIGSLQDGPRLSLPSPADRNNTADLVVNLFPLLERLTIVRRPIDITDVAAGLELWRHHMEIEDSPLVHVRRLFGETISPALVDELDRTPVNMRLLKVVCGQRTYGLRWDQIPQALLEHDEKFLRLVNRKIQSR